MNLLGMIAREYFTEFRRLRGGAKAFLPIFWTVYVLLALPELLGYFDSIKNAAIYMTAAIPFGWAFLEANFWQIRLPKLMFLCPMDEKMRRSYIKGACRFRVIFHTALGALGAFFSLFLGNDWLGAVGLAANTFLLSLLCIGVDTAGAAETEDSDTDDQYMSRIGRLAVRAIGAGLAVALQIIHADVARGGGIMRQARWEQVVIGCMAVLLLLFAAKYRTYWRAMQEEAIHYEQAERRSRNTKKRKGEG